MSFSDEWFAVIDEELAMAICLRWDLIYEIALNTMWKFRGTDRRTPCLVLGSWCVRVNFVAHTYILLANLLEIATRCLLHIIYLSTTDSIILWSYHLIKVVALTHTHTYTSLSFNTVSSFGCCLFVLQMCISWLVFGLLLKYFGLCCASILARFASAIL